MVSNQFSREKQRAIERKIKYNVSESVTMLRFSTEQRKMVSEWSDEIQ